MGLGEHARVPAQEPLSPDADARGGRAAARLAVGELRDHAVPLQQARPPPPLPGGRRRAGDDRQRDVLRDRQALSARGARDVSGARLPALSRRGRRFGGRSRAAGAGAEGRRGGDRRAAQRLPRVFLDGRRFIGGDHPSIADIRLAATLEFLHAIDYPFPAWATDYMAAVEAALGDAYAEPVADVRRYIAAAKR